MGDTFQTINDPADLSGYRATTGAAKRQLELEELGIAEQRRQFDVTQETLRPFLETATGALASQEALTGGLGPEAQAIAFDEIRRSPKYQSIVGAGADLVEGATGAIGESRSGDTSRDLSRINEAAFANEVGSQKAFLGGLTGQGPTVGLGLGGIGANAAGAIQQGYSNIGKAGIYASQLGTGQRQDFIESGLGLFGLYQ